jgi:hypothetical protein
LCFLDLFWVNFITWMLSQLIEYAKQAIQIVNSTVSGYSQKIKPSLQETLCSNMQKLISCALIGMKINISSICLYEFSSKTINLQGNLGNSQNRKGGPQSTLFQFWEQGRKSIFPLLLGENQS